MASRRYWQLEGRFRVLKRIFLPKRFNKTGTYSSDTLDRARAFRVLMHAEIESYLEDRVLEAARKTFAAWRSAGRASVPLTALLASFDTSKPKFPHELGATPFVQTRVGGICAQFEARVRENHGIRSRDVLALLLTIGVDDGKIDQAWLATIDGFGSARGDAAHQSGVRSRVKYQIDPQSDYNTVQVILDGLKALDQELTRLVESIGGR